MIKKTILFFTIFISTVSYSQDTIIYLSKSAGIVSDASIEAGSLIFGTDNTNAVQNVLNVASHTKSLKVIWDVKVSVRGLIINPNTCIQAISGNGAILRDRSNRPMFVNADTAFGREPVDSNIIIDGGIWNGNNYRTGLNPAQDVGSYQYGSTSVFAFYGVRNLQVKNFTILRQRAYAIHGINIRNGLYENGIVDCGSNAAINSDGVHFDGYSEHCIGRNLTIKSFDDAIACNADDLYRSAMYFGGFVGRYYYNAAGPINDVLYENVSLNSGKYGFRILSGSSRVDNIIVKNIAGKTLGYSVVIDNYNFRPDSVTTTGPGNVGTVTIDNDQVNITGSGGSVHNSLININCNIEKLILKDIKRYYTYASSIPSIYIGAASNIKSVVVDGFDSYDTTSFNTLHIQNLGVVENMSISRANVSQRYGSNSSYVIKNLATIKQLLIDSVLAENINGVFVNSGLIKGNIVASNINHISNTATFQGSRGDTVILNKWNGTIAISGTFVLMGLGCVSNNYSGIVQDSVGGTFKVRIWK